MDENTRHLLRQYRVAGFLVVLTLIGLIGAIWRGEYVVPLALATAGCLTALQIWATKRRVLGLFRKASPDHAVAYYRRTIPRAPNGVALCAYMCGLAFALYGEYEKARDELATVSWSKYPPMYEGLRTYVLSIIAILEKKDFSKALDLAMEARDLREMSAKLPGSATSKHAFDAHVLSCQLLVGGEQDIAAELERVLPKLSGTAPVVIPAWSLAQHYTRTNQQELANIHIATLQRLVPYCKPLVVADRSPSPI